MAKYPTFYRVLDAKWKSGEFHGEHGTTPDSFACFVESADEQHCREARLHYEAMIASEPIDPELAELLENDSIGGC